MNAARAIVFNIACWATADRALKHKCATCNTKAPDRKYCGQCEENWSGK